MGRPDVEGDCLSQQTAIFLLLGAITLVSWALDQLQVSTGGGSHSRVQFWETESLVPISFSWRSHKLSTLHQLSHEHPTQDKMESH